jgi:hypothetical protein
MQNTLASHEASAMLSWSLSKMFCPRAHILFYFCGCEIKVSVFNVLIV